MLDLVIIVLLAAAIGAIVWAADRKRGTYGVLLPAGVAVVASVLAWIITIAAGLGYQPGWTWVPWVVPVGVATAASFGVCAVLGSSRARYDTAHLTAILKG